MSKAIKDLSKKLSISEANIRSVINRKAKLYRPVKILKEDCSPRDAYKVFEPLKSLHSKIKESIFDKKRYPSHLHGGIRRRSIITNAKIHLNAKSLIMMDIKNFFPSITKKHILCLFKKWGYNEDVAEVLADILTLDDKLPQGMSVSSLLSNFMIPGESRIVKKLKQKGYRYSRYIDDIAVSSKKEIPMEEIEKIKEDVSNMIIANGFSINQKKTRVYNESISDKNDEMFMVVAGVKICGENLAVSTCYYNVLKKTISNLSEYSEDNKSIRGKISYVKFIDPEKGKELETLLSQVLQGEKSELIK